MFRCITELKGLAIDIDSFNKSEIEKFIELNDIIPCVFITEKDEIASILERSFDEKRVIKLEFFEKLFSPNKITHIKVLDALSVKNTELAYLSKNHSFLEKANGFLSGTIWITDRISYAEASNSPDLIRKSLSSLISAIKNNLVGFYGEMKIFPKKNAKASMLPVEFDVDDEDYVMYTLGRYYGYSHYMSQLHPYSSAIFLNKGSGRARDKFNADFIDILSLAIRSLNQIYQIDGICAVPVKPGKPKRFTTILSAISENFSVENFGDKFVCVKDYPDQKLLSKDERIKNIKGAFRYNGDLSQKTIILFDDISSTGSTIKECIRELKSKGALKIIIVVLAINQDKNGTYWSSNIPKVSCPKCGEKMKLFVNGKNKSFFYSCPSQSCTMDFTDGWKQLCDDENDKFHCLIKKWNEVRMVKENDI